MTHSWRMHGLLLATLLAPTACGARDWKGRLQERLEKSAVEHPLATRARTSHKRALEAEEANLDEEAMLWALAADRFLSAAVVRVTSAKLQRENEAFREELAALSAEVETLEANVAERFEHKKELARQRWLEDAKTAAYSHAEEYEAKRFRKRNADSERLKHARDELVTLAKLQLEGARALNRNHSFDDDANALGQCGKEQDAITALDCVNQARWQIQEHFSKARRRHGLTADDTAGIKAALESQRLTVRWQNDALAIVADMLSVSTLRLVLKQTKGPVQAHGPRAGVARLQRTLRAAGAAQDRVAKPVEDDGEQTVLYFLAYPRPKQSQSSPGSH